MCHTGETHEANRKRHEETVNTTPLKAILPVKLITKRAHSQLIRADSMPTNSPTQRRDFTYVIQKRVFVFPLVLEELVQPVGLEDALRLIGEEDGVAVKRHPQLGLGHLRQLLWHEHGGCGDA